MVRSIQQLFNQELTCYLVASKPPCFTSNGIRLLLILLILVERLLHIVARGLMLAVQGCSKFLTVSEQVKTSARNLSGQRYTRSFMKNICSFHNYPRSIATEKFY